MDFDQLRDAPRLLMRARLKPVQGHRFQPTGFPDLGAAEYELPGGGRGLLVESAQSMANRLESVCWDTAADDVIEPLQGLPYVRVTTKEGAKSSSILEAHRLNSPYITSSPEFEIIENAIGFESNKPFDRRSLAQVLMRFDPNSLIHGIFLTQIGGILRLPRALSSFIEAEKVQVAPSGGVKVDRIQPGTHDSKIAYGKAEEGYGNVPYHRDEYVAESITAYFNLDLALLRGYGFDSAGFDFLVGLALFKIRALLHEGLRLRTACDLDAKEPTVNRPKEFELPDLSTLRAALPRLLAACKSSFNDPPVLELTYSQHKTRKKKK